MKLIFEGTPYECVEQMKEAIAHFCPNETLSIPKMTAPKLDKLPEPKAVEATVGKSQARSGAGDCLFCGKACKRLGKHEPYCLKNPKAAPHPRTGKIPAHIAAKMKATSEQGEPVETFDETPTRLREDEVNYL